VGQVRRGAIVLNMPCRRLGVLLSALGFSATLTAQGPPPRPVRPPGSSSTQCGTQSSDQVVSPVAMASWLARVESDGTRALVFIVLWRGSPGWFARGSGNGASGGGNCRLYHKTISRGDVQVQIEFDSQTRLATISQALLVPERVATIRKRAIELRDQNVILVDGVDEDQEPQIVGTLRVDPTLPPGRSPLNLGETLRQSQEMLSFLRCDTRMADALAQKAADIVCASVRGQ
jgi:hypothetical protein